VRKTLEHRITSALTGDIRAADLAMLITETGRAFTEAETAAEQARERALDPVCSPDGKSARETVVSAEFARDRLQTVLPRLRARYRDVAAAEYLTEWRAKYETLKVERDALAAEFRAIYPGFERAISDLFSRIAANDAEISRLHHARPANTSLHLLGAELVARELDQFSRDEPSIALRLTLPKFAADARLAWPLHR
jgi:hypothetical protein